MMILGVDMGRFAAFVSFALLGSLAAVTGAVAGGPAAGANAGADMTDGFVSVAAGGAQAQGYSDGSVDGNPSQGLTLTGAASIAYQSATMLGFQGDVVLSRIQRTQGDDTGVDLQGDVAGHVFYREPGNFLVGVFGQLGADNVTDQLIPQFGNYDLRRGYAGAEAQIYLSNFTLYGQIAAQRRNWDGGSSYTGVVANLEARYFLTPNFKVDGHVGLDQMNYSANDVEPEYKAGIGAEYRLDAMPVTLFAKYDFTHDVWDPSYAVNDNRVLVGLKWDFGADTLEDRDHSGASLKPLDYDPMFVLVQP